MAETKKLFDQFAPVTPEEWRAKAEVDLKGADFEKKMVWRTNEGFNAQPLYRSVDIADLKQTKSLPGGINSIGFHMHGADVDLKELFKGISLPACEINIMCCPKCAIKYANELVALCKELGCEDTFVGSITFNPFKRTFKHGEPFPGDIVAMATELMNAVKPVAHLRVLSVDSLALNNAGAYIYQELGYALAWGAEWMAMLTEAGFSADEVANRIKFNMGVSTVYFMEIAKFRAARELWALIVKQFNPANDYSCMMNVNAETSRYNQTIYDSYTEAMSAALACVDSIVVTPFDAPYKESDDFSERIARNQQILLKEESHLDKVVDPAGGSYYVEMLTKNLAEQGWKLFLDVEDKGGFKAALESGDIINAVNATANERFDKVAKRREQLLGTNQFPNFTEKAADKADACKECNCHCSCNHEETEGAVTLNTKRLATQFEEVRLATEHAANTPKVFMLTIGNLAMRLARAQFSDNFFACAGYELIDNNGFKTVKEGMDAAMEKKADVVVLCSSDDEYAALIPEAVKELNGRAELVLAGPETDEFKAMGITNFINVRTNVLATLKAFNAKLLK